MKSKHTNMPNCSSWGRISWEFPCSTTSASVGDSNAYPDFTRSPLEFTEAPVFVAITATDIFVTPMRARRGADTHGLACCTHNTDLSIQCTRLCPTRICKVDKHHYYIFIITGVALMVESKFE